MSGLLGRGISGLALAALLLGAREARAQQNLDTLTFTVGPPSVALLLFDTAMIVSLAGDGTARRGFAVNGIVFSGVNGLMGLLALSTGQPNPRGVNNEIYMPLVWASLALSLGSAVLSIYAAFHGPASALPLEAPPRVVRPPPPSPPPAGPQLGFSPFFGITPGGSLTGGAGLTGRW